MVDVVTKGVDFVEALTCYDVDIMWDDEAYVWVAVCDDIPLALEGGSYDALIERVKFAALEILELNSKDAARVNLRIRSERLVMAG